MVSIVSKHGKSTVQRRVGSKVISVVCPNDIILYQQGICRVEVVGADGRQKKYLNRTFT